MPTDEIFIRGGLPEVAYRQTLKHELAHRRFFLHHLHFRNFFNRLHWKPAFYYKLAPFFLALGTILLWWDTAMILFFVPVILYFWIFYFGVEFLAEKAEHMASFMKFGGLTARELFRFIFSQVVMASWFIIFVGIVPLWAMGVPIDTRLLFTLVGLALFAKWGLDIMQIKAMEKLRILVTKNWEVSK